LGAQSPRDITDDDQGKESSENEKELEVCLVLVCWAAKVRFKNYTKNLL
jgi:hypothetical protein